MAETKIIRFVADIAITNENLLWRCYTETHENDWSTEDGLSEIVERMIDVTPYPLGKDKLQSIGLRLESIDSKEL